jgi:protein TonB
LEGKVYVNFKINTDGTVKVIHSRAPDPILDKEAIRIIESLPLLNPGKNEEGELTPVSLVYPIVFKLK